MQSCIIMGENSTGWLRSTETWLESIIYLFSLGLFKIVQLKQRRCTIRMVWFTAADSGIYQSEQDRRRDFHAFWLTLSWHAFRFGNALCVICTKLDRLKLFLLSYEPKWPTFFHFFNSTLHVIQLGTARIAKTHKLPTWLLFCPAPGSILF